MEPLWSRSELEEALAKARAADLELRALGLEDNACGRLAARIAALLDLAHEPAR